MIDENRLAAFRARIEGLAASACKALNPSDVAASFLGVALAVMESCYGRDLALRWFAQFNTDLAKAEPPPELVQ